MLIVLSKTRVNDVNVYECSQSLNSNDYADQ